MDVMLELDHLNKLAKEDPTRRFNRLYRLLRQEQFLMLAKERIAHNKGANTPGVDTETQGQLGEVAAVWAIAANQFKLLASNLL